MESWRPRDLVVFIAHCSSVRFTWSFELAALKPWSFRHYCIFLSGRTIPNLYPAVNIKLLDILRRTQGQRMIHCLDKVRLFWGRKHLPEPLKEQMASWMWKILSGRPLLLLTKWSPGKWGHEFCGHWTNFLPPSCSSPQTQHLTHICLLRLL